MFQVTFEVEMMEPSGVDKKNVRVEVVGPNTKPPVTLSWYGSTGHGDFTPVESGVHQVYIYFLAGIIITGLRKLFNLEYCNGS